MPKLLNRNRHKIPPEAVYIGRGSPFGNPFCIGPDGTREEVIRKYREFIQTRPDLLQRVEAELKDKDLVCFCSPKACHGEVFFEILYGSDNQLSLFEEDL